MSRKKSTRKTRNKTPRRKSRSREEIISSLGSHTRVGTKLQTPFSRIDKTYLSSWADDHMPEMLWAVLLTAVLSRDEYLVIFRNLAMLTKDWFIKDENAEGESADTNDDIGINFTLTADQTKLAQVDDSEFEKFVAVITSHPLGMNALRPLLLLKSLPGHDRWKKTLAVDPDDDDFDTLAIGVAGTLNHQSEQSTDIRWFKFVVPILAGRMHFAESMSNLVDNVLNFPNKGDLRSVRPAIRSGEMTQRRSPPSSWVKEFWREVFDKTLCIDASLESDQIPRLITKLDPESLYQVREEVIHQFYENLGSERVDARIDSSFGLVLYALSILEELGLHKLGSSILGRLALRSLVEVQITLRYLVSQDSQELWSSFRVYGSGQSKLAFLKVQEIDSELPSFIDEETLYDIFNEDKWGEFLDIDIGHWAKTNLRKMAVDCGAKDFYDKYYDWSSAFIHGNWASLRDTNFITCHNPLHRLHRIPRSAHRRLSSVEVDALELLNEMLKDLKLLYPSQVSYTELKTVQVQGSEVVI